MQAQTPEVSAEKATTPDELRLVSVEQLKKIHRDLDACQKVIWLAGCRPRGYGFDPSYVTDAQERLKEIEALLEEQAPAPGELLPCPFCGQSDFLVERLDNSSSIVICQGMVSEYAACLAQGPVGIQDDDGEDQPGKAAAIREWNGRAFRPAHTEQQPEQGGLVEALEAIIRQYPNPGLTHEQYRVNACRQAEHALAQYRAALLAEEASHAN